MGKTLDQRMEQMETMLNECRERISVLEAGSALVDHRIGNTDERVTRLERVVLPMAQDVSLTLEYARFNARKYMSPEQIAEFEAEHRLDRNGPPSSS